MYRWIIGCILVVVILWNAIQKSKKEGFRLTPDIKIPKIPRMDPRKKIKQIINETKRSLRKKKQSTVKETLRTLKKYI